MNSQTPIFFYEPSNYRYFKGNSKTIKSGNQLVFYILIVAVPLLILLVFYGILAQTVILGLFGKTISTTIINLGVPFSRQGDTLFEVELRVDEDNIGYMTMLLNKNIYNSLSIGNQFLVKYTKVPYLISPANGIDELFVPINIFLGIISLLIGAFEFFAIKQIQIQRRKWKILETHGIILIGEIVRTTTYGELRSRSPILRLECRFITPDGKPITIVREIADRNWENKIKPAIRVNVALCYLNDLVYTFL